VGMKIENLSIFMLALALTLVLSSRCYAAYYHMDETDSRVFLLTYPDKAETKLDGCNLCHTGGQYEQNKKIVTVGSCQWCHRSYGYDASGNILDTLNPYGLAYKENGRNGPALIIIESQDSDGDGYSNKDEINAVRFPGDQKDDPTKVPAPSHVFTRAELELLPQHTQYLLMNAHKSTDFYAQYSGVSMAEVLKDVGMRSEATGIMVYAPDGFAQYHPLLPDGDPLFYHVVGDYPEGLYHYEAQADISRNPETGWCDYRSPFASKQIPGQPITNPDGNRLILAFNRDGKDLDAGVLGGDNKLNGEGPYRIVPPQKNPGPPDQRSTATDPNFVWPFDANADHNAGYSTRTTTIIRVEPLPEGTTDIDTLEAGWSYVDEGKIVVYGNIDPVPTIKEKAFDLLQSVKLLPANDFRCTVFKALFLCDVKLMQKLIDKRAYKAAGEILEHGIIQRTDGCTRGAEADRTDWITDCEAQKQTYWASTEIQTLMKLIGK
jgi:hypothetical protein